MLTGIVCYLKTRNKNIQKDKDYSEYLLTKDNYREQTIFICGLGKYSQLDLEIASKEITKKFGFKCKIIEPRKTYSKLYDINGEIDFETFENSFKCRSKIVYITNEYISIPKNGGRHGVSGVTSLNGNCILVCNRYKDLKITVLHEVAHTLGLRHCKNKCIMVYCNENKGDKTLDFCDKCKLKLNLK